MIFAAIGIGFKRHLAIVEGNIDDIKYRRFFKEPKICKMLNEKYGEG